MASRTSAGIGPLSRVSGLEKRLMKLVYTKTTLTDEELNGMGIHRGSQLNVDKPTSMDPGPVFFEPLPDSHEFQNAVEDSGKESGLEWSPCLDAQEHRGDLSCQMHAIQWFNGTRSEAIDLHHLYLPGETEWVRTRHVSRTYYTAH